MKVEGVKTQDTGAVSNQGVEWDERAGGAEQPASLAVERVLGCYPFFRGKSWNSACLSYL